VRGFIIKKVGKIANHPSRFALYNTLKGFGSENFTNDLLFRHQEGVEEGFWIDKGQGDMLYFGISASKKEVISDRLQGMAKWINQWLL
jgi:hypothetical protein